MHYLTDRLPKSNYGNEQEHDKIPKLSQSTKTKNPTNPSLVHPSRHINLPKLDRIIVRNSGNNHKPQHLGAGYHRDRSQARPMGIDVSNLLKIEGKNSSGNSPKY